MFNKRFPYRAQRSKNSPEAMTRCRLKVLRQKLSDTSIFLSKTLGFHNAFETSGIINSASVLTVDRLVRNLRYPTFLPESLRTVFGRFWSHTTAYELSIGRSHLLALKNRREVASNTKWETRIAATLRIDQQLAGRVENILISVAENGDARSIYISGENQITGAEATLLYNRIILYVIT